MGASVSLVIFGASGDLAQRKLIPGLFSLHRKNRLPPNLRVVGFAAARLRDEEFRRLMRAGVDRFAGFEFAEAEWQAFAARLHYLPGDFTAGQDIAAAAAELARLETGPADRLYYLATPPRFFEGLIAQLGAARLTEESDGWRRVVIEKPFGHDLASARSLNQTIHRFLREEQIYRIDHYLGKETVQNLLVFRFANAIFEPIWNRNFIDHVQITVAETVGVAHRAAYYDGVGVLRDMFQNHLLQLLALVAMEPPAAFSARQLRNEKVKVLSAIRPIPVEQAAEHAVRGQYRGYRAEPGVAPDSHTATYAALRLFVDNWRWQGVPFYLRSGKRLAAKTTEIVIQFKCPPHLMFPTPPDRELTPNLLALCLQPDEGIHLRFEAKTPDTPADMRSVDMEFHYADSFGPSAIPDAYERLLLDALNGDASLFTRSDQIELAWGLIDPIIAAFRAPRAPPPAVYPPGAWGPPEADEFLAREGRAWLRACGGHSPR